MAIPEEKISTNSSPPISSLGESGFLPRRPISSCIDSITQGFRFAAPAKKPPVAVGAGVREGVQEAKFSTATYSRERIGGPEVDDKPNPKGTEALKIHIPTLPSTSSPLPPRSLLLPLPVAAPTPTTASTLGDDQAMLPPPPAPRPHDRGRNHSMTKEKRKRIDSSSSLISVTGGHTQPGRGSLLSQGDREHGRFEISGTRNWAPKNGGRRIETSVPGAPSDEWRPRKKRQDKLMGPQKPRITPPVDGNRGSEIIVLDDDVKVEGDTLTTCTVLDESELGDLKMDAQVQSLKLPPRRGTFQIHVDQPTKPNALRSKGSNKRTEARADYPNERTGALNPHLVARAMRGKDQAPGRSRSSVSSDGALRKKRHESNTHVMEPQTQQSNMENITSPKFQEEPEQGNTGEHRLLVALTTLTTEKQTLEKKLHDSMILLKTQAFRAENSERKGSELQVQLQTSRDNVAGLKKKMMGFQKFADGLGKDYNMLSEKNTQLNNKLNEALEDRDELVRSLQDVKCLAERVDVTVQGWGSSGAMLKEAHREIEKLNETLKFLHSQLSENAGLLAAERDRTQNLESQTHNNRKNNEVILAAIQEGRLELVEKLTKLHVQCAFEANTELELEKKIIELQMTLETKIEADGDLTRHSVSNCSKAVETLGDREIDAAECLIGVEKLINHTSDGIMGLFQETHKMNAEALLYTDGYINHLTSRIRDLEAESREMREKYEISLMVSAEKKELEKTLEQQLKITMEKCNYMDSQLERGKLTENDLNERISILQKKLAILETRHMEDLNMIEAMNNLKQKNFELQKESDMARNEVQDVNSSIQMKDIELETLKSDLAAFVMKHKEYEERIGGFEKEKAILMACAEEQKMKERIEVETNANMFRQRETSRLSNQIKALEAQKERLEAENKSFRATAAEGSDRALDSGKEITNLQKKYTVIEKAYLEMTQEKARLEHLVMHSTEIGETALLNYSTLEKHTETSAGDLSKALEKIEILERDKQLLSQEIANWRQELERTRSENYELQVALEGATEFQIVENQLREALGEEKAANDITRRVKGEATNASQSLEEMRKVLEEKSETLIGTNKELEGRNSNTVTDLNKKLEALRKDNEKSGGTDGVAIAEPNGIYRSNPQGRKIIEASTSSWGDGSPPLSPFTPQGCIFETQIDDNRIYNTPRLESDRETWSDFSRIDNTKFEQYLFRDADMVNVDDLANDVLGDSMSKAEKQAEQGLPQISPITTAPLIKAIKTNTRILQPRKNMATKFTAHRRLLSVVQNDIGGQAAMIEDFSDDGENRAARVGIPLSRNANLEQINPIYFTPKPHAIKEKDTNKHETAGNFKSTPTERFPSSASSSGASSNKPKTPQRNNNLRGGATCDNKETQQRPRKGRKNRDDQEWVDESGSPRNNRGKEETTPNMKKSLRSYSQKKKSGKRFM